MSGEAAALGSRERAVVTVDVRNELTSDKGFPIAGGDRAAVEAPSITGIGIWHHQDHLVRHPFVQSRFHDRRHIHKTRDQAEPPVVAIGEPVQDVEHRIAPGPVGLIAGGQIDRDIAVR
jgi:hypothetical protein